MKDSIESFENKHQIILEEDIKSLGLKATKLYLKIEANEKTSLETVLSIGSIQIDARKKIKKITGKIRGIWPKYRQKYFGEIPERRAQKYFRLAKNVDLKEHPRLKHLGQNLLFELIHLSPKGSNPGDYLQKEGVMDFDDSVADDIKGFKSIVVEKINILRNQKKLKNSVLSAQKIIKVVEKLMTEIDQIANWDKDTVKTAKEKVSEFSKKLDAIQLEENFATIIKDSNPAIETSEDI